MRAGCISEMRGWILRCSMQVWQQQDRPDRLSLGYRVKDDLSSTELGIPSTQLLTFKTSDPIERETLCSPSPQPHPTLVIIFAGRLPRQPGCGIAEWGFPWLRLRAERGSGVQVAEKIQGRLALFPAPSALGGVTKLLMPTNTPLPRETYSRTRYRMYKSTAWAFVCYCTSTPDCFLRDLWRVLLFEADVVQLIEPVQVKKKHGSMYCSKVTAMGGHTTSR